MISIIRLNSTTLICLLFMFMHICDIVIIQFKSLIKMNIFTILFLTAMSVIAIKECMARHLLVEIQHTYGRGKLFFFNSNTYILPIDISNLVSSYTMIINNKLS